VRDFGTWNLFDDVVAVKFLSKSRGAVLWNLEQTRDSLLKVCIHSTYIQRLSKSQLEPRYDCQCLHRYIRGIYDSFAFVPGRFEEAWTSFGPS
jgi:hypothetical protein